MFILFPDEMNVHETLALTMNLNMKTILLNLLVFLKNIMLFT